MSTVLLMSRGEAMERVDEPLGASLAHAFVAGTHGALEEIYRDVSSLVYSLAVRSLGDVTEAEDVTQQTFVAAWRSRESFDLTAELCEDGSLVSRGGPSRTRSNSAPGIGAGSRQSAMRSPQASVTPSMTCCSPMRSNCSEIRDARSCRWRSMRDRHMKKLRRPWTCLWVP